VEGSAPVSGRTIPRRARNDTAAGDDLHLSQWRSFSGSYGYEIEATVDEQEQVILSIASSQIDQAMFVTWVSQHIRQRLANEVRS